MSDIVIPTAEFIADLEALCRKHKVTLYGADYHDVILISNFEWTKTTRIVVDEDGGIDFKTR
jgi:hypothetical protein